MVFSGGIKIVVIVFSAWIISLIARLFISKIVKAIVKKGAGILKNGKIQKERINTLIKVFISITYTIIWTIAILMALPEFNINITPLLAGAGLAGLAIGMGARSLIQDYLFGIFILLEDQYREGEDVMITGIKGSVTDFNLRRTVIKEKDLETIHYIPNGQINKVANFSRK